MGFSVEWDNAEKTTLRYTVWGHWTWGEFYVARDDARNMADAVAHSPIHAIIDIHAASLFPENALSHFQRISGDSHPKLKYGVVVIVENNLFVRSLIKIMRQLSPAAMKRFYRARTLEEARSILFARRAVA